MSTIQERAKTLIKLAGMDTLVREGEVSFSRWQGVRYKGLRMSTNELEIIQRLYPEYRLWLISGEVAPEIGQTSPEYDATHSKLDSPNVG